MRREILKTFLLNGFAKLAGVHFFPSNRIGSEVRVNRGAPLATLNCYLTLQPPKTVGVAPAKNLLRKYKPLRAGLDIYYAKKLVPRAYADKGKKERLNTTIIPLKRICGPPPQNATGWYLSGTRGPGVAQKSEGGGGVTGHKTITRAMDIKARSITTKCFRALADLLQIPQMFPPRVRAWPLF